MSEMPSIELCKYIIDSEVCNLSYDDKVRLLTKVAKNHKEVIFTSGEGTQIRLDPLPDEMIYSLYNMIKKCLNL